VRFFSDFWFSVFYSPTFFPLVPPQTPPPELCSVSFSRVLRPLEATSPRRCLLLSPLHVKHSSQSHVLSPWGHSMNLPPPSPIISRPPDLPLTIQLLAPVPKVSLESFFHPNLSLALRKPNILASCHVCPLFLMGLRSLPDPRRLWTSGLFIVSPHQGIYCDLEFPSFLVSSRD